MMNKRGKVIFIQLLEIFPVILHFDVNIIQNQVVLHNDSLIGPVLIACRKLNNVGFADKVWDYITKDGYCKIKPNQVLYSKLMKIYSNQKHLGSKK